jgi:hypothetical protein
MFKSLRVAVSVVFAVMAMTTAAPTFSVDTIHHGQQIALEQ